MSKRLPRKCVKAAVVDEPSFVSDSEVDVVKSAKPTKKRGRSAPPKTEEAPKPMQSNLSDDMSALCEALGSFSHCDSNLTSRWNNSDPEPVMVPREPKKPAPKPKKAVKKPVAKALQVVKKRSSSERAKKLSEWAAACTEPNETSSFPLYCPPKQPTTSTTDLKAVTRLPPPPTFDLSPILPPCGSSNAKPRCSTPKRNQ